MWEIENDPGVGLRGHKVSVVCVTSMINIMIIVISFKKLFSMDRIAESTPQF